MDYVDKLKDLFEKYYGVAPRVMMRLPGAGGNRRYFRMSYDETTTCLGVAGDSLRDCEAFVALSALFRLHGVAVPRVYASDFDGVPVYLEEDLGDVSLFSNLCQPEASEIVGQALSALSELQDIPVREWKDVVAYAPFSARQVMWDLNYFKYDFLKPVGVEFDENLLEEDFEMFSVRLVDYSSQCPGFMFRDFQSRNVMVRDGRPWFIDFQGGRLGPVIYDAVSFLWQARAGFSDEFRREMMDYYISITAARRRLEDIEVEKLRESVAPFVLFRTLQVLGAYGFRGLIEKRAHFVESIPGAVANLLSLVDQGTLDEYPELKRVAMLIAENPRFAKDVHEGLVVTVYSFSYKKGYPEDLSGNGGGFMFDCRGMSNPGRYDKYKLLTGLDEPVIEFLKDRGEADTFCAYAEGMVAPSVERYLKRGFTNLQLGFGCTGGRHRSVYCAERVARSIAAEFPAARVHVVHREQDLDYWLDVTNPQVSDQGKEDFE